MLTPKKLSSHLPSWLSPRSKQPNHAPSDQHHQFLKLTTTHRTEAYEQLKCWDRLRAHRLALHRRVIDEVINEVARLKDSSEDYVRVVGMFVRGVAEKERDYAGVVVGSGKSGETGEYNAEISIPLKQIQHQQKLSQQISELLPQLLLAHLHRPNSLPSRLHLLRLSLQQCTQTLRDLNKSAQQKCSQISSAFHEQHSTLFKNTKDLYSSTVNFLQCADKQYEQQRRLGKLLVEYVREVGKELREVGARVGSMLRKVVGVMRRRRRVNGKQVEEGLEGQQKVNMTPDAITQIESIITPEILSEQTKSQIQNSLNIPTHNLCLPDLLDNLLNFPTTFPFLPKLLLKQCRVSYLIPTKPPIPTLLSVTCDGFLHLRKLPLEKYSSPEFSFKYDKSITIQQLTNHEVSISCRTLESSILGLLNIGVVRECDRYGKVFEIGLRFQSEEECRGFNECLGMIVMVRGK